jgi:hypothetical protein
MGRVVIPEGVENKKAGSGVDEKAGRKREGSGERIEERQRKEVD